MVSCWIGTATIIYKEQISAQYDKQEWVFHNCSYVLGWIFSLFSRSVIATLETMDHDTCKSPTVLLFSNQSPNHTFFRSLKYWLFKWLKQLENDMVLDDFSMGWVNNLLKWIFNASVQSLLQTLSVRNETVATNTILSGVMYNDVILAFFWSVTVVSDTILPDVWLCVSQYLWILSVSWAWAIKASFGPSLSTVMALSDWA